MSEKITFMLSTILFFIILYLSYKDKKLFEIRDLVNKFEKYPIENKLAFVLFIVGLLIGVLTKIYVLIPGSVILSLILPNLLLKKRSE
ncbi:MAG: hypothetical protein ACKOXS_05100 [Actinomycetes bacterium]